MKITTSGSQDWNGAGPLYYATATDGEGNIVAYEAGKTRSEARSNAAKKVRRAVERETLREPVPAYDQNDLADPANQGDSR